MTVPYVLGKLLLKGSLVENEAYRLNISPTVFLDAFHLYLNPLFYQDHVFRDPNTIQLLFVMLVLAVWRRNRHLLFAWFFLLLSGLPVFFMAHHSAFFMYIPSVGWALYIAGAIREFGLLLEMAVVQDLRRRAGDARTSLTGGRRLFSVGLRFFWRPVHPSESRKALAHFQSGQGACWVMSDDLKRLQPDLPHGSHVYFCK